MSVLEPNRVFAGRYRIERFLAQGGYGAVYVAEQLATEARVAIKVLLPHVLASREALASFEQEARIAGRLNSEHIVRVIDAGQDAETGMPFLVMELLSGEELQKVVESQGPLPPATVLTYARQIAAALDKAHTYVDREGRARPIIHRDLKPDNLFLTRRDTGEPVVKILDFGIAKVLSQSMETSRQIKGTPVYMSFEQAAGKPVAAGTDVWALGLIVFFLLTGKIYWRAANVADAALHSLYGEIVALPFDAPSGRLRSFGCGVKLSAGFDAWFLRCLERDISLRFGSAGEAVDALATALASELPSLHRTEALSIAARAPGPIPITASPAASVPLASVPPASSPTFHTEAHGALGQTKPTYEPKPSRLPALALVASGVVLAAGVGVAARAGMLVSPPAASAAPPSSSGTGTPSRASSAQAAAATSNNGPLVSPAPAPSSVASDAAVAPRPGGLPANRPKLRTRDAQPGKVPDPYAEP